MKRIEYNRYYNLITTKDTTNTLTGESLDLISELRSKASVAVARVGQELAIVKNQIDKDFLSLKADIDKISNEEASKRAEEYVNRNNEVSRRELQYLRDALYNFCNACASRLTTLKKEIP